MPLEILDGIDRWIAENRPAYYTLLRPGASREQLDEFERAISQNLPNDFRQLYQWHDGQERMSFEAIQGNRSFMSLGEIRDAKRELDGMVGLDFEDPKYWRQGWIPFLHNGGGSYLCIDVAAEDGGQPGQLIGFWKADSDRPIEFDSLDDWLQALWKAMMTGTLEII